MTSKNRIKFLVLEATNFIIKVNSKNCYSRLTELLVSVKLLRSFAGCCAALLPRFARPFGVLESNSSVGESQNLSQLKIN